MKSANRLRAPFSSDYAACLSLTRRCSQDHPALPQLIAGRCLNYLTPSIHLLAQWQGPEAAPSYAQLFLGLTSPTCTTHILVKRLRLLYAVLQYNTKHYGPPPPATVAAWSPVIAAIVYHAPLLRRPSSQLTAALKANFGRATQNLSLVAGFSPAL